MKSCKVHLGSALVALLIAASASGEEARDLTALSLEELSNVEVTSVSRKEEPLAGAAAAIAVISNEELRRSGVSSIPEALRLAPGLHVAQATSNIWAISSRGFSSGNSAKLLVLSDTRSIYTPLFSGVFWDVQDFLLEDVDRVEIVRGPGGSLWGANAVNGVINITSKSAKETQGAYFEGGGGTTERGFGGVRYGGQLEPGLFFRIFAKGFDRTGEFNADGSDADKWKMGHLGFRADWELTAGDKLTLQGDAYTGDIGQITPAIRVGARPGPPRPLVAGVAGGNVLARYTHTFSPGSDFEIRAYYDGTHRDDPSFLDDLDTLDVEFQHRFQLPLRQEVIWGLDFRSMDDRNRGKGLLELDPSASRDNLVSGFVQDQIAVLDTLKLTLGTKLEHNDFSGYEYQPTARLAWNPFRQQLLWGAVSRAVRVPTRLERDINVLVTAPGQNPSIKLLGSRAYGSERLLAWEMGYRWEIAGALSLDLAAYYNQYHGLDSLEFNPSFQEGGTTVLPVVNKNLTDGVTKGGEASLTVTPARPWRMIANYTWIVVTIDPHGQDLNGGATFSGLTPRHQIELQSYLDLPARFQLDAFFRYASELLATSHLGPGLKVPSYATADVRLSWQALQRLEISLVGRSLLQAHHLEFPGGSEVERSAYARIAGRF
ncbi:MAG: TonB-dependent receptor [Deltaproteobacteria bacterium]|nr:MAG: TonB-dependent receptor [Deltaproteobacteria bacterium]